MADQQPTAPPQPPKPQLAKSSPIEDLVKFLRNLWSKETRYKTALDALRLVAAILAAAYVICLVVAIGQIMALGAHAAYSTYRWQWLSKPLRAASVLVGGAFALVLTVDGIAKLFGLALRPLFRSDETSARAKKRARSGFDWAMAILMLGLLAYALGHSGYDQSLKDHTPVTDADKTLAESKAAIGKQRDVMARLSDGAKDLVAGLDKTATDFQRAKEEVTVTLGRLTAQQEAVNLANQELEELLKKQDDIRLQQVEIDRKFNGRYVPTRDEIDRNTWIDRITYFFMGITTSIIATWLWSRLQRKRDRRTTAG